MTWNGSLLKNKSILLVFISFWIFISRNQIERYIADNFHGRFVDFVGAGFILLFIELAILSFINRYVAIFCLAIFIIYFSMARFIH